MRHGNTNRKFGREQGQRKALMRSLARSLVLSGKIETTIEKSKELRPFVEKLVTKAKHDTLASKRIIASRIHPTAVAKMIELGNKYSKRQGGYTRIVKIWRKTADGSSRAVIEFV